VKGHGSLRISTETINVKPTTKSQITATTSEGVEIARMRIPLQRLLNQESKTTESTPHIGVAGRKPNTS
jgi:hypothetical protein